MQKDFDENILMPQMFGHPFYPLMFPFRMDHITIANATGSETVLQVWHRYCQNVLDNKVQAPADEEILKAWVIYYIGAPIFETQDFDDVDLSAMTFHQLIDACMQIGLDPM